MSRRSALPLPRLVRMATLRRRHHQFCKGKPRHHCSVELPGLNPSPHMQQARLVPGLPTECFVPCMCTTSDRGESMRSNSPGGTLNAKAFPDAPDGLARPKGQTRADLSKPRVAHRAGVIIPVNEATPGA
jgi:hypothetical protein